LTAELESPSELLARLQAEHPGWEIHANPVGLGLWTAEHRSDDGRSVHYIVCHTGAELASRLDDLDRQAGH
jgi:hypothetical protein